MRDQLDNLKSVVNHAKETAHKHRRHGFPGDGLNDRRVMENIADIDDTMTRIKGEVDGLMERLYGLMERLS